MADVKISALPVATSVTTADIAVVNQSATTKQSSLGLIHAADKDVIRAWLPPYNVGPSQTASLNVSGINQAITDAANFGLSNSGTVLLPKGTMSVNAPIITKARTALKGVSPAETILSLAPNSNCNIIQDEYWVSHTDWWHWAEITDLQIQGNKANQTVAGSGIAIWATGEIAQIDRVWVGSCGRYGVEMGGGFHAPMVVRFMVINNCSLAKIRIPAVGAMLLDTISGDGCGTDVTLGCQYHLTYGIGCIVVLNDKTENITNDSPIFRLENFEGQLLVLGGKGNNVTTNAPSANTVIRITGTTWPEHVSLNNYSFYSVINLIEDQVNGRTIPWSNFGSQGAGTVHYGRATTAMQSGMLSILPAGGGVNALNAPKLYSGTGIPAISAPNGSIFLRTDGTAGAAFYVRRSGAWGTS